MRTIYRTLAILTITSVAAGTANAVVYDFRFLSGGGNGAAAAGQSICLDVSPSRDSTPNRMVFTLWSQLSHPKSRIGKIIFDTGRHAGLFASVSMIQQSQGIASQIITPSPHAFLPSFSPDHWIEFVVESRKSHGLAPGNFVRVVANLAEGKTYMDGLQALQEGLNPTTGTNGLRVGVIVYNLLGGPPPGLIGTISDDGGFTLRGIAQRCTG